MQVDANWGKLEKVGGGNLMRYVKIAFKCVGVSAGNGGCGDVCW